MLDHKVETFLALCQTMNYTRAAEQLHITQPAVSQHIRALEAEYGARFFAYEGKQLSLTEAGTLFLRTASAARHDDLHLKELLRAQAGRHTLHFGATLTIGEYLMPGPLSRLLRTDPDLRLRMVVNNTDALLAMLDRGEIDFAVIEGFFPRQDYDGLVFAREEMFPVCAPANPLAAGTHELRDLLDAHLLVREEGSGTREMLQRALQERGLSLADFPHLAELGSLNAIKALVLENCGITFCYRSVVARELAAGTLCRIDLPDFTLAHDFTFLWQKNSVFAPYYREVFTKLRP
ncbi:LysR family transcriptional regulator [uncultured Gemmiger sp.]|uniref:LysR family transcriptional regulator n=1 Tax=uncultured Gemmiger sp. TaxID=1623490 RepID=UPI0025E76F3B|nr:LysR family transcriptional regulator [uncultured Gemmiger sp.]